MNDPKSTVRYIGYHSLGDGGRGFDFSHALGAAKPHLVTIEASPEFFSGPERISLQEAAGICFETLKVRFQADPTCLLDRLDLTAADIAQHRKAAKAPNR